MMIFDYFIVAGIAQSALLVFIILVMKRNRRANLFYAIFIIIISCSFVPPLLRHRTNSVIEYLSILIVVSGIALSGPMIYFYSGFITNRIEKINIRSLVHFIPAVVILFLIILAIKPDIPFSELPPEMKLRGGLIFGTSILVSLIYMCVSYVRLKYYEKEAKNYYSDYQRASVRWLKKVFFVSILFMGMWNAELLISMFILRSQVPQGIFINYSILILMLFVTAYYIVNQPEVFRDSVEMNEVFHVANPSTGIKGKMKYARHSIGDATQKKYLHELEAFVKREKPYLRDNLTIKDLAEMTSIPAHHLSIAINNVKKINFYTFINEYRVAEAIRIIAENPDITDSSILSIAFRSGFNSKSTFNDAFKKVTGKTPSEYRLAVSQTA